MEYHYGYVFSKPFFPQTGTRITVLMLIFFLPLYLSSKTLNVTLNYDLSYNKGEELSNGNGLLKYASSSTLSSGNWIRIATDSPGIYKLTFEDLVSMQVPVQGAYSANIRIHGYGGVLPENAGIERYDDIPELAIMMFDGGDNNFDPGDYLLFYSPGPNKWRYNSQNTAYEFLPNIYSDFAYYFVTVGDRQGKRISQYTQPESATTEIRHYDHRDVQNSELVNLIKSGRGWYGDLYDIVTEREYSFNNISIKQGTKLELRFSVVARSFSGSSFTLLIDGINHTLPVSPVISDYTTNFAHISTNVFTQNAPAEFSKATVKYNKSSGMDAGWLNFIEVNATADLTYRNRTLDFRAVNATENVEYLIANAPSTYQLWEVTSQITPKNVIAENQSGTLHFKSVADTVREYILASESDYKKPSFIEPVANQNLHSWSTPTMLIIAPPQFMSEAVRLATFHGNNDDMEVAVVTPQAIYNEFSSGAQDISAIRDFIKMLWHKAEPNNLPRYVLLFGDASYDFKDRIDSNTNLVPTYQSPESLHPIYSFATDDYFVCIDDHEGGNVSDVVDIGIGRLPVVTLEEAAMAVDKIIHYATARENVSGDWRNVITFVADDEDGNIHMSQADQIATMIDTTYRNYNVDKIFLDAYQQESMAGGQRSSDATAAINQRVNKGSLIINYTGHGGETGWTKEEILQVKDIVGWTNYDRLPVFMTATCEFSRYDDPERISGGEYAFLNKKGGAIALFTTARPTYGTPNFVLARNFYNIALAPVNGHMPRLGDIIRMAKVESTASDNIKKFVLLGNPALTMAYPELRVITTEINGHSIDNISSDTLKALQEVTIKGMVTDNSNVKISDFNGVVNPTVFDKPSNIVTLGSDGNTPMTFSLLRNIIYKGQVEVKNGEFEFSFIVPRDIAYNFGNGKISYYASNDQTDASGHTSIIVGGFSDGNIEDNTGPVVTLYMNDSTFRDGGFTNENPIMLAYITDQSGINTLGNSIGHDIIGILDGNTQNPYILNEYYEANLNTYKNGSITYPFFNLEPGPHTLTLQLWDVNNNPSEVSIRFNVATGNQIVLADIEAWPNPMVNDINFFIGHNQAGKELDAELAIYDLAGARVAYLGNKLLPAGYRSQVFRWDGTETGGKPLASGLYIANLRVKTPEGYVSDKSVKIIIAR